MIRTPDPLLAKYTHTDRDSARRGQLPAVCSSLACTIRDGCYRKRLQTQPALGVAICPAGVADSLSRGSPWRPEIVLDVVIHPSSDPPDSGVVRDGDYMEQLQGQDAADYIKRK